ncbi:OmpA family protein [Saprospira grandis]|uniref:OmpA family protein n=1 Tax=Saprospira grandis TaxID=1008 RepID=UPI0022DDA530|nr:OmpA family protein [Saprospira grandis]WBM75955.1 OmpA family protein [Saprospira grandis]
MSRYFPLLTAFLFSSLFLQAQQTDFHWKIGASTGFSQYYGDLNERPWTYQSAYGNAEEMARYLSYQIALEKRLSAAWTLRFSGSSHLMQANDRYQNRAGELQSDDPYFDRALNAEMQLYSGQADLVYYTDNGRIFGPNAFCTPFFSLGLGFSHFSSKADLYLANGQRYHYWSDGRIYNLAENDPNAHLAFEIEQDGIFETDLQELETEGQNYSPWTWQASLGLGLKFRLAQRLSLQLQTQFYYTFSDYLDDVSGDYPDNYNSTAQAYAANPSNQQGQKRGSDNRNFDAFSYNSLGLYYSFGWSSSEFDAPIIFTNELSLLQTREAAQAADSSQASSQKTKTEKVGETQPVETYAATPATNHLANRLALLEAEQQQQELLLAQEQEAQNIEKLRNELLREQALLREQLEHEQALNEIRWRWLRQQKGGQNIEIRTIDSLPTLIKRDTIYQVDTVYREQQLVQIDTVVEAGQSRVDTVYQQEQKVEVIRDTLVQIDTVYLTKTETEIIERDSIIIIEQQLPRFDSTVQAELLGLNKQLELIDMQMQDSSQQLLDLQVSLANLGLAMRAINEGANDSLLAAAEAKRLALEQELQQARDQRDTTIIYYDNKEELQEKLAQLRLDLKKMRRDSVTQAEEQRLVVVDTVYRQLADSAALMDLALKTKELADLKAALEQKEAELAALPQQQNEAELAALQAENRRLKQELREIKQSVGMLGDLNRQLKEQPRAKAGQYNSRIYFANASAELSIQAQRSLDLIGSIMQQQPNLKLDIAGYASKTGNSQKNEALSAARAEAVKRYLLERAQLGADRITVAAFGERKSEGNALEDRRVELRLY